MTEADGGHPAVGGAQDGMDPGAWLRRQREDRFWSRPEMARQLIAAAHAHGDTAVPDVDNVAYSIYRWERGVVGLTERYKLCYCKALGIPLSSFGMPGQPPRPGGRARTARAEAVLGFLAGLAEPWQQFTGLLPRRVTGIPRDDIEWFATQARHARGQCICGGACEEGAIPLPAALAGRLRRHLAGHPGHRLFHDEEGNVAMVLGWRPDNPDVRAAPDLETLLDELDALPGAAMPEQ